MLAVPDYTPPRHALHSYHKQLVMSRTTAFHQHNLKMLGKSFATDPETRRKDVIQRVARELWTNFVARGDQSAMLQHLCDAIRKEYNEDFQFTYEVGGFELIILRKTAKGYEPISNVERVEITNRAWHIAVATISEFTLS